MEYREEIKKAMDYIEEHLDQEIRAADAADMARRDWTEKGHWSQ